VCVCVCMVERWLGGVCAQVPSGFIAQPDSFPKSFLVEPLDKIEC